jgi:hypothetical protein
MAAVFQPPFLFNPYQFCFDFINFFDETAFLGRPVGLGLAFSTTGSSGSFFRHGRQPWKRSRPSINAFMFGRKA